MSNKTLYFDSLGGASGDMLMAALIDLGVSSKQLMEGLSGLNISGFNIQAVNFCSHGLKGIQVNVQIPPASSAIVGGDSLHGRGLSEIRKLIQNAGLTERSEKWSIKTFEHLAAAEAKIHSCDPEQVHFHEVGALDSIIDIVGSCIALDILDVKDIACGVLPLGKGLTKCRHGTIPVPAPATLELLKGMEVTYTNEPFELVTPTGAALLSAWKTVKSKSVEGKVINVGYGFGHRELICRPNLIRSVILDNTVDEIVAFDECIVLECNIDDTIPELLGSLSTKLMAADAIDVFSTPVLMKKQRPGTLLTVLCRNDNKESLLDMIFTESTTFGVREYIVKRSMLERKEELVETKYGKIRIKAGMWKNRVITRAPEHEDCARLSETAGVSIRSVYEAALYAALEKIR